jgi:hypothetical protein
LRQGRHSAFAAKVANGKEPGLPAGISRNAYLLVMTVWISDASPIN